MDGRLRLVLLGAFVLGLGVSITLAETALALLALLLLVRVIGDRAIDRIEAGGPGSDRLLLLARLIGGRARMHGWPLASPFLLWIAASLLSALFSAQPWDSLLASKDLLLIAAFYVMLDALDDVAHADRVTTWLVAVIAFVSVVGILQVASCPAIQALAGVPGLRRVASPRCERAHAFYSIYMTLAGVLTLALLSSLPRLVVGWAGATSWRLLAWLTGAVALVLTFVRGAWVGFLAGTVVLLGLMRRGRVMVIVSIVVLGGVMLLLPAVRKRAESIADPTDPTARERLAMWSSALGMARARPLTGVGPGQVKREYPRYAAPEWSGKRRGHVHDTPLQVLIERGALGLLAWAAIFVIFFWRAVKRLRELAPDATRERALVGGSIAAITGFLVGGLTEYNFGDSEVVLVAYVIMAVPFVVARD